MPRKTRWVSSHPRTFRAFLFNLIGSSDLKDDNRDWLLKVTDPGFVFRMLELSGVNRTCFIPTQMYGYLATEGGPKSNQAVSLAKKQPGTNRFALMAPSQTLSDEVISERLGLAQSIAFQA